MKMMQIQVNTLFLLLMTAEIGFAQREIARASTNGIGVVFRVGWGYGANTSTDGEIIPEFIAITNNTLVYIPDKNEYFCQAELYDQAGKAVAKTPMGKQVGSSFTAAEKTMEKKTRLFAINLTPDPDYAAYSPVLHSAAELFDIKQPGVYRLALKFQVFVGTRGALKRMELPWVYLDLTKPEPLTPQKK